MLHDYLVPSLSLGIVIIEIQSPCHMEAHITCVCLGVTTSAAVPANNQHQLLDLQIMLAPSLKPKLILPGSAHIADL
jgi:hypothetical protein